jgi:hypothetical protein
MATSEENRRRRADQRRQRREVTPAANGGRDEQPEGRSPDRSDGEAQAGGAAAGSKGESTLKTGATLAAAGAVLGAAIGAANAVRSRSETRNSDDDGSLGAPRAQPSAPGEESADAPESRVPERPSGEETRDGGGGGEETDPTATAEDASSAADADGGDDLPEREPGRGPESESESESEPEPEPEPGSPASIVRRAQDELSRLTGRDSEGVLGFERTENGWLVQIEVVELKRIPPTTDVLGAYDVEVDDDGGVRQYRRSTRYVRSRAGGGGA